MPTDKQLINAKFASDATGKATTIPDKKCITYAEMQTLLPTFSIDIPNGHLRVLNFTGTYTDKFYLIVNNTTYYLDKNFLDIEFPNNKKYSINVNSCDNREVTVLRLYNTTNPKLWQKGIITYSNQSKIWEETLYTSGGYYIILYYANGQLVDLNK